LVILVSVLLAAAVAGCGPKPQALVSRADTIPAGAVKRGPDGDSWPPRLNSTEWQRPVPLPGKVNTAGAEDSPYVSWDGREFYFFFAGDLNKPVQQQLTDGATGIYVSARQGETWGEPSRVVLSGDLAMDGCQVVHGDTMWFASARRGNLREIDVYTAQRRNGSWGNVHNAGKQLNETYDIGEFHITPDGRTLYFHAERAGGRGKLDLYVSKWDGKSWSEPVNLGSGVNTPGDESRPFVTMDETELWFTGDSAKGLPGPAVFRSRRKDDGSWGKAEEVVSCFAGEPVLDGQGNLYFIHHYFSADLSEMIEADIYVAYRKE
jgi:hypothetical protein